MEYKDYYKILGVDKSASKQEIKKAYKKLARKYHPDVSQEANAEEKFKEINEAHEVLKDPEKRKAYDQLGTNWNSAYSDNSSGFNQRYSHSSEHFSSGSHSGFSDFFEQFFNHGSRTREPSYGYDFPGEDVIVKVMIDVEDAYLGASRQIRIQLENNSDTKTLNVKIPKGVKQGQHIRLSGQGHVSRSGGQSGDLFLEIDFKPHPYYQVDGKDVYLDLPISPWEAELGESVKVPTPTGPIDVKIPAGSKTGRKLRLKNRGIPSKNPGDMYLNLTVVQPKITNDNQKKAYENFKNAFDFNPRKEMGV